MNVFLEQLGCRLNYGENHLLARQLRMAGHRLVDSVADAHVAVVNTCAVTTEAGRKSRQLIRLQHRHNPTVRIVATGCYATLEPETVQALPGVWKVTPNEDKDLLAGLLEEWSSELPDAHVLAMVQPDGVPFAANEQGRTRAFIKVQDGCNNKCTFCVVTLARGHGRSVDPGNVVHQIRDLCAAGYREAVLTGVHLGSYGRDFTGPQSVGPGGVGPQDPGGNGYTAVAAQQPGTLGYWGWLLSAVAGMATATVSAPAFAVAGGV